MATVGVAGLELVKEFEGLYLTAYQDSVGVWTIGYGHTGSDVKKGMKISRIKADELLAKDMQAAANTVDKAPYIKFKPNTNQRDALISFCFNCGAGHLKKLCSGRTADKVAENITKYNKAGGKILPGLTRRRKAEKALFLSPVGSKITSSSAASNTDKSEKEDTTYSRKDFITALQKAISYKKTDGVADNGLLIKLPTVSTTVNSQHKVVKPLQKRLRHLGYYTSNIDGDFGPKMKSAVEKYQKKYCKVSDGIISKQGATWKKMLNL